MNKPKISVAIPTHEMAQADKFLFESLMKLEQQKFTDFEVVVSDNSDNNKLKETCDLFSTLNINYFKNPIKGMAPNSNSAIKACKGELIKLLYLDDFLMSPDSLGEIVLNFHDDFEWLVTGCKHTTDGMDRNNPHLARYRRDIITGHNTIGSPSVVTIRNNDPLLFDENLTWLLDCDLYKRYYDKYGLPKILDTFNVVIRQGDHQMTNILSDEIKQNEHIYLYKKYANEEK